MRPHFLIDRRTCKCLPAGAGGFCARDQRGTGSIKGVVVSELVFGLAGWYSSPSIVLCQIHHACRRQTAAYGGAKRKLVEDLSSTTAWAGLVGANLAAFPGTAGAEIDVRLRGTRYFSRSPHAPHALPPRLTNHPTRRACLLFTCPRFRSAELEAGHSNGPPAPTFPPDRCDAVTQCLAAPPERVREYICQRSLRFVLSIFQISSVIFKSV
jgi:hypothetical protein